MSDHRIILKDLRAPANSAPLSIIHGLYRSGKSRLMQYLYANLLHDVSSSELIKIYWHNKDKTQLKPQKFEQFLQGLKDLNSVKFILIDNMEYTYQSLQALFKLHERYPHIRFFVCVKNLLNIERVKLTKTQKSLLNFFNVLPYNLKEYLTALDLSANFVNGELTALPQNNLLHPSNIIDDAPDLTLMMKRYMLTGGLPHCCSDTLIPSYHIHEMLDTLSYIVMREIVESFDQASQQEKAVYAQACYALLAHLARHPYHMQLSSFDTQKYAQYLKLTSQELTENLLEKLRACDLIYCLSMYQKSSNKTTPYYYAFTDPGMRCAAYGFNIPDDLDQDICALILQLRSENLKPFILMHDTQAFCIAVEHNNICAYIDLVHDQNDHDALKQSAQQLAAIKNPYKKSAVRFVVSHENAKNSQMMNGKVILVSLSVMLAGGMRRHLWVRS